MIANTKRTVNFKSYSTVPLTAIFMPLPQHITTEQISTIQNKTRQHNIVVNGAVEYKKSWREYMLTDEAEWRPGYEKLYVGIDPQKVHMELYEVGEAPTPQEIVDYARDSSTELHKCFQWDDTIAAEQWRKQQARLLQYHIVVKEPDRPKDRPPVRLRYVEKGGRGYKSIIRSVKDEDSYEKILARAYAELAAFKEKYKMLRELPDMLAEMIELIRKDEAQDE